MKISQRLIDCMSSLIERYGITLTEVPERFKEKLLVLLDNDLQDEIELAFKPLALNCLKNIRVRATHKISAKKVDETKELLKATEEFTSEEIDELIILWLKLFNVEIDATIEEIAETLSVSDYGNLEFIQDVSPIEDRTSMSFEGDFETVVNQFDNAEPVEEPQIEEYDGHFEDSSFETVADFSISETENRLNKSLEDTSESINQILEKSPDYHQELYEPEQRKESKPAKKNAVKNFKNSLDMNNRLNQSSGKKAVPENYTIDTAFKALREGNHSLVSRIMMELARNGNLQAQFHLGEFYLSGTGVEKSKEKALYWLRKAASRGSIPAKEELERIDKEENSSGCCGCLLIIFLGFIVMNLIGSLL